MYDLRILLPPSVRFEIFKIVNSLAPEKINDLLKTENNQITGLENTMTFFSSETQLALLNRASPSVLTEIIESIWQKNRIQHLVYHLINYSKNDWVQQAVFYLLLTKISPRALKIISYDLHEEPNLHRLINANLNDLIVYKLFSRVNPLDNIITSISQLNQNDSFNSPGLRTAQTILTLILLERLLINKSLNVISLSFLTQQTQLAQNIFNTMTKNPNYYQTNRVNLCKKMLTILNNIQNKNYSHHHLIFSNPYRIFFETLQKTCNQILQRYEAIDQSCSRYLSSDVTNIIFNYSP